MNKKYTKNNKSSIQQKYRDKIISAKDAANLVKSGDHILYAVFLGRPVDFDLELSKRKCELFNVQITQCGGLALDMPNTCNDPTHEHFICNSWFFDVSNRRMGDKNLMFYHPCQFSQIQDIISKKYIDHDIYVQQVSPMDKNGSFSFGPTNVNSLECALNAGTVILEVNKNIPRIPGGSEDSIHLSMADYIIEGNNTALAEIPSSPEPSEAEKKMAIMLLEQIPDRACLQLGIGGLPNTLGALLCDSDLKDLGIHTEMFVDSMVKLFDSGIVTGKYKTTDRCKMAFTFALGSKKMYSFMENNPVMASHCGKYTNDARIVGLNDNLVSINNILMIDLFSQACAESSGTRQISGTGGQVDFINAAWNSNGGKSFLCLSSTYIDKNGKLCSRIRPRLPEGSIVTTPRTIIDYIVTEYGVARLKGKSAWERSEILINLSHPEFRDELVIEAEKMKIWKKSNKLV